MLRFPLFLSALAVLACGPDTAPSGPSDGGVPVDPNKPVVMSAPPPARCSPGPVCNGGVLMECPSSGLLGEATTLLACPTNPLETACGFCPSTGTARCLAPDELCAGTLTGLVSPVTYASTSCGGPPCTAEISHGQFTARVDVDNAKLVLFVNLGEVTSGREIALLPSATGPPITLTYSAPNVSSFCQLSVNRRPPRTGKAKATWPGPAEQLRVGDRIEVVLDAPLNCGGDVWKDMRYTGSAVVQQVRR